MVLSLTLPRGSYDITIERGVLSRAGTVLNLNRKVLIVTDSGVPHAYADTVASQCREAVIARIPQGEGSKTLATFEELCRTLLAHRFSRTDCVVAVGGGVVGDLAGFVAASYMRGIDFYNIPTTVLSQVDSSIGGKVAVDLDSIKNIIGAFYQPKAVLVDADTLHTLPSRQIANGLAEALKMALTFDADLFTKMEQADNPLSLIDTIITRSLEIKQHVVEQDETEKGLRRTLNFGHTIGHAIESVEGLSGLYHGECVALGMLPLCADTVRPRLERVLQKLGLPTVWHGSPAALCEAALHDKKFADGDVTVVTVPQVGTFALEQWSTDRLARCIEEYYG